MKKFDIFYFSSTHWDREWYQDFEGFRYRLVKMVNALLDLLKTDKNYKTFHFDGQTIVLEDYLEICPERRAELASLIEEGRILIGPWYVMPDEFLVSGESLIRNLTVGHKIAESFGVSPWKFGYVCDCFGHIAQLPQIFSGFGIKYSLLGRGTNEDTPAFVDWYAPDGSKTLNYTLEPDGGYGNFCFCYNNLSDRSIDNPEMVDRLKNYVDAEIKRADGVPVVIIMDGLDHMPAEPNTSAYIKKLRELYPEADVHHVDLCRAMEIAEERELPRIFGELNLTAKQRHSYLHLITNTLSSYYPIKRENDICQNLLEKKIEPLCVMSMERPEPINRSFVDAAYRSLLKNHPHDSICGCSIDEVHRDMEYRFAKVREICSAITEDYLYGSPETIIKEDGSSAVIRLYNTLAYDVNRTVRVDIPFTRSWKERYSEPFGYEEINSFKIYDESGSEIPYKVTNIKRGSSNRYYTSHSRSVDIHTVTMTVSLPAMGYSEYKILPIKGAVRYLRGMKCGQSFAENEYIRMDINSNGSIKLTDRCSGRVYDGLCSISDDGEIGDGWYHAGPVNDSLINTLGSSCVIERIEYGPSRVVFRITRYMDIPKEMLSDSFGKRRSTERCRMELVMTVALSSEAKYLDVKLETVNLCEGHRMKLLLPTGITADTYFASQAFYFPHRRVGIDYETENYREHDQYEKSTSGIVGKRDTDGCGIAFISPYGIHECSSYEGEEGMLALTLLRSFRNVTRKDAGDRCRLIGTHLEYRFALMPLLEDTDNLEMLKVSDMLATDPIVMYDNYAQGRVPEDHRGPITVTGKNITVSIVKRAEAEDGSIVVRVYNCSDKPSEGRIESPYGIKSVESCDLLEKKLCDVKNEKNSFAFNLAPWRIATYKIFLDICA